MLVLNKKLARLLQPALPVYLGILVICAAAALFLEQHILAACEAGGALVLLIFALVNSRSRKRELVRYIQSTTDALDVAIRSDAPIAKVLLDPETEEILWANGLFCKMVGVRDNLISTPLTKFLPELDLSLLRDESVKTSPELRIGTRRYHIYGNVVSPKSEMYPSRRANL